MTKYEIREKLRNKHIGAFGYARRCAEHVMAKGWNDDDTYESIKLLAIRANAIIECAQELGVELDRTVIDLYTVKMWRINLDPKRQR